MSTCQLLSGRSKAAHTTSAGSRLSARKLAMRRAGASSAVSRATKVAVLVQVLFRALVTAVYARGRRELPQELSTGYRQAYRPVVPATIRNIPPTDSQGTAWKPPIKSPAPNLSRAGV